MLLETAVLNLTGEKGLECLISRTAEADITRLLSIASGAMRKILQELDERGIAVSTHRVKSAPSIFFKLLQKRVGDINLLTDVLAMTVYTRDVAAAYDQFCRFAWNYELYGKRCDTLDTEGAKYHSLHFLVVTQGAPMQVRIKPKRLLYEDTMQHHAYKRKQIKDLQRWLQKDPRNILELERRYRTIEDMWAQGRRRIGRMTVSLMQALNDYSQRSRNYETVSRTTLSEQSERILAEAERRRMVGIQLKTYVPKEMQEAPEEVRETSCSVV